MKARSAEWRFGEGWAYDVKVRHLSAEVWGEFATVPDDVAQELEAQAVAWWWDFAGEVAREIGFSGVASAGRSDGWLLPLLDGAPVGGVPQLGEGWQLYSGPEYSAVWAGEPQVPAEVAEMLARLGERLAEMLAPDCAGGLLQDAIDLWREDVAAGEASQVEADAARVVDALVAAREGATERLAVVVLGAERAARLAEAVAR
jgi:hypothetical protein